MNILIKKARIIDPTTKSDFFGSILIEGKRISKVGVDIENDIPASKVDRIIEGQDLIVFPGFFDMHVHLREPGYEYKETILSGSKAAAKGGFTGIACMPNTSPVLDNASLIHFIYHRSKEALCRVYPIGAISKKLEGKELAEMGQMVDAGAVGFSDDGHPVESGEIMRNAMHYANMLGKTIISHCEEKSLTRNGVLNEGRVSSHFGLYGIPAIAEELMVTREVMLAEYLDVPIHIAHVSTKGSVEIIRQAKAKGVKVTAEVTPHHLVLADDILFERQFDPNLKMNPPLRSEDDRKALIAGLVDGTIDVIATDHAPHAIHEKDDDFPSVPFGVIGLETAVGVVYDRLVNEGHITPMRLAEVMAVNPRIILDVPGGFLSEGALADITIVGQKKWKVNPDEMVSLSRNTPFAGWELTGKALMTICDGEIVHDELS